MDCSLPGSFIPGIFQAGILKWVAISFSSGSSWPWDWTHVFCVSRTGRQILGRTPGRKAKWDSDNKVLIQFNSPSWRLTIKAMWEWWQESLFMCTYYVPYSILSVLYFQFLIFTTVVQNYRGGEEDSAEPDLVGLFSSSIHGFPLWTYLLGFSFFISLLNVPHSFPLSSIGYFQVLCLVFCNVNLLYRLY